MKYLIINFYSPKNAGDLAILEETVKLVRLCDSSARITVCASDWSYVPTIEGVTWIKSWNFLVSHESDNVRAMKNILSAYLDAEIIISLGGGYFFVHDHRPVSTYATISLLVALMLRKPVICLPQSFGPFRHHYQAWLAAKFLEHVKVLMIREDISYSLLAKTDPLLAQKALLVPDTAFNLVLDYKCHDLPNQSKVHLGHEQYQIGITLLDWTRVNTQFRRQYAYEISLAEFIVYLYRELRARVTIFVQCQSAVRDFESDLAVTKRVANLVEGMDKTAASSIQVKTDLVAPADYLSVYGTMDYFIGTRMHSLIFAACAGVPIISIGYQHKSLGVMKMLGLEHYSLEMSHLSTEQLIKVFDEGWARRDILKTNLNHQVRKLAINTQDKIVSSLISEIKRASK